MDLRCWNLVGGAGGIEVLGGDDLDARGGDERPVDEDEGAGCSSGVGDLGAGVGWDRCAEGDSAGGQRGETVGAGGDVEIAGVCTEGHAGDERSDRGKPLAGGDEIEVDGAGSCGLVEEAESDLTGGCRLALIGEGQLLQAGDGVAEQDGVLGGRGEGALDGGEDLFASSRIGVDGVDAGGDGNVGGDRTEAEVEGHRVRVLVDVEAGRIRRGVDDADLRFGMGADDGLATSKSDRRDDREGGDETSGGTTEMERFGKHGRSESVHQIIGSRGTD